MSNGPTLYTLPWPDSILSRVALSEQDAASVAPLHWSHPAIGQVVNKPYVAEQLNKLSPTSIYAVLSVYEEWVESELQDDAQNLRFLVWVVAGELSELLSTGELER